MKGLKKKREELYNYILTKDYGYKFLFEELNQFLNYDLSDLNEFHKFKVEIGKIKIKLYEVGIVIKSVPNIGYYILKPNQISSYTYRTFIVKPMKSYNKAKIILENTKTSSLKDKEMEKYVSTCTLNNDLINLTNNLLSNYTELD